MTDRQIEVLPAPAVELLIALAPLAAREGRCPGHMQVDLETMPDAYLAVDMPRENAQPEVLRLLKALAEMRS